MFVLLGLLVGVMSVSPYECEFSYAYYLEEDSESYTYCETDYTDTRGCYELDVDNYCTSDSCMYGFYWDGEYCDYCDSYGMTCDEEGIPLSCYDGEFLGEYEGEYECMYCGSEFDDCYECNAEECFVCGYQSTLYQGECYSCEDSAYEGYDYYALSCDFDGDVLSVTECIFPFFTVMNNGEYYYCGNCENTGYVGGDYDAASCDFVDVGEVQVTACTTGYCLYEGEYECEYHGDYNAEECTYDGMYYTATACEWGYGLCTDGYGNTDCYNCENYINGGAYYAVDCTFVDDGDCNLVDSFTCSYEGEMTANTGEDCLRCYDQCAECSLTPGEYYGTCTACPENEPWEQGYYMYYVDDADYSPEPFDVCLMCDYACAECTDDYHCDVCVSQFENAGCYDYVEPEPEDDDDEDEDDTDDVDDDEDEDGDEDEDEDDDRAASLSWNVLFF